MAAVLWMALSSYSAVCKVWGGCQFRGLKDQVVDVVQCQVVSIEAIVV